MLGWLPYQGGKCKLLVINPFVFFFVRGQKQKDPEGQAAVLGLEGKKLLNCLSGFHTSLHTHAYSFAIETADFVGHLLVIGAGIQLHQ